MKSLVDKTQSFGVEPIRADPVVLKGPSGQPAEVRYLDRNRGFKSTQVHQTICSNDGRIWSATPLGLSCYDGVSLQLFGSKDGLSSHGLRTIEIDNKNRLWLGSDVGIDVVDIDGAVPVLLWSAPIGTVNCSFISDIYGLFGTASGLYEWTIGQTISKVGSAELRDTIIKDVVATPTKIWVSGPEIGVLILDAESRAIKSCLTPSFIGTSAVLVNCSKNTVFAGGDQRIVRLNSDGKVINTIKISDSISALTYRDDFIWAGAADKLFKISVSDDAKTHIELVGKDVQASHIMFDSFNNIWISSYNKGLGRISGQRRLYDRTIDIDRGSIYCIKNGRGGNLIGSQNGLSFPNGTTSLDGIAVWDVIEDSYGKIWSATAKGLYCLVNPNFNIPYHHKDCLVLAAPCRALIFYNGELFVGSIRGLARLGLEGPAEIFTDQNKSLGYVYSLHIGPDDNLWIATLGNGLWRFDGQRMVQISGGHLRTNCNAYALATMSDGSLFVAHDEMISKIDRKHGPILFASSEETVAAWGLTALDGNILLAGTSEGLVFYDSLSGDVVRTLTGNLTTANWEFTTSRSLYISDDQDVVFCGLASGLGMINLAELFEFDQKPSASLGRVNWRGVQTETSSGNIIVEHGNWYLEIVLRMHWYVDEFACSMRVKLEGFDTNWSEPKPIGTINYTSLPIGKYVLNVEITSPFAGKGPVERIYSFIVT